MKKSILTLILSAVLLPFAASAQNIKFEEYDLDNGLHVILSQNHKTPNVVISVMYHVGSKNEEPHLTGFAHFFEHLMFEGTENIGRGEYATYVSEAGGSRQYFVGPHLLFRAAALQPAGARHVAGVREDAAS